MCAVEMAEGESFDVESFGPFIAAQPEMGAKWWPTYVRVTDRIPLTGSGKVNKAPLRNAAWNTHDPVYIRVGRTSEYVPLDDAKRASIEAEIRSHGRASLLPTPLQD